MTPYYSLDYNLERLDWLLSQSLSSDPLIVFGGRFFYTYQKILKIGMETHQIITTDWDACTNSYHCHRVAENIQETVARFITNFMDE